MSDRFFLDTNVLVYAFDAGSPAKAKVAANLVRTGISEGNGAISYQVAQEFLNVAMRRFATPLTPAEAIEFAITVLKPLTRVHSSQALLVEALGLVASHKLAWYDSLILASALESGASVLYSEDFQHGQRFGALKIVNPFRT